ncbi:WhiB family transcriptional regulator [Nakamurella alba]|uniref:WhiB family transcriptional regulator n=1 Tax=Nakamurella alba TaxID=2665158 RepID=UPI0012B9A799|nr:WhiB family transcriptional regulator [Nakamurella alba]
MTDSPQVIEEIIGDPQFARELPCHTGDPDLFFAERPEDLEKAKVLCADCPLRAACLAAALERSEPWGVWGGEIFDHGVVIARKRPRGRPRKVAA